MIKVGANMVIDVFKKSEHSKLELVTRTNMVGMTINLVIVTPMVTKMNDLTIRNSPQTLFM